MDPFLESREHVFSRLYLDCNYPPNTLLVIDGLVDKDMLVEVVAIAVVP